MRSHEHILVFGKKRPRYYPEMTAAKTLHSSKRMFSDRFSSVYGKIKAQDQGWQEKGVRYPRSVIKIEHYYDRFDSRTGGKGIHPTKKPLNLFRYIVRLFTQPGDIVFDGYSGSGTTAISAQMEGRNFIVCENNQKYFQDSVARLDTLVKTPTLWSEERMNENLGMLSSLNN